MALTYKELLNRLTLLDEEQLSRQVHTYEEDIDWVNRVRGLDYSKNNYAAELELNTPVLLIDIGEDFNIVLDDEEDNDAV